MKKIILGLFLILGALSFASPSFVDVNKIKQNSYEIYDDDDDFFTFVKSTDEAGISVTFTVICYISVLYATDNELSNTELNNAVDKVLNEVESYLK